jgi:hypothetical protein
VIACACSTARLREHRGWWLRGCRGSLRDRPTARSATSRSEQIGGRARSRASTCWAPAALKISSQAGRWCASTTAEDGRAHPPDDKRPARGGSIRHHVEVRGESPTSCSCSCNHACFEPRRLVPMLFIDDTPLVHAGPVRYCRSLPHRVGRRLARSIRASGGRRSPRSRARTGVRSPGPRDGGDSRGTPVVARGNDVSLSVGFV